MDNPNANNDVKNGELVHFRGAIQNDYHYAMHDSSIRVKLVDGRIVCMFPIFVNPNKIEKRVSSLIFIFHLKNKFSWALKFVQVPLIAFIP